MNSNMASSGAGAQGPQAGGWLDFYALLGVNPQAEGAVVRKRIGEAYSEATANIDHRDLNRRHYFQTMVEQVLPQCRRVLLDPTLRSRYDEENARHAAGDASALDYVSFMASLQGASADSARQAMARSSEFDLLPERVRNEINLAQAVIQAVQSGSEFDLLPARTLSSTTPSVPIAHDIEPISVEPIADAGAPAAGAPPVAAPDEISVSEASARPSRPISRPRPQPAADEYFLSSSSEALSGLGDTMPVEQGAPSGSEPASDSPEASASTAPKVRTPSMSEERLAQLRADARSRRKPEAEAAAEAETEAAPAAPPAKKTVTAVPNNTEAHIRAQVIDLEAQGKSIAQLRDEAQNRAVSGGIEVGGKREPEKKPYRPRVSVGDDAAPPKAARRRALLSPVVTHLAMGVVSASLMGIIWSFTAPAAAVARVPLNVIYSSELKPVLESAEAQFEASPEGQGTDVVLVAGESRTAMNSILSPARGASVPDVWIPSEAVWSNRFNEVAARLKRRAINAGSGLASSPLVLVARSDQAAALRTKFPKRLIPSWTALRQAVAKNCAQHFGMTDPEKSGGGALVRTAMAREWCSVSKLPFAPATMADKNLWSWMNGFETNVPQYKMGGDMVKDMALGTSAQYWWALAYESEAIYWIGQSKPLEVFYLPATFYADHPFCRTESQSAAPGVAAATAGFEKFLRSTPVQQAFLQSGFRAPEIDLASKVKNNPFQSKEYAARGVRAEGFPLGGRLDYRTVNALVAAWKTKYSS